VDMTLNMVDGLAEKADDGSLRMRLGWGGG
jgi:hypothetical protein